MPDKVDVLIIGSGASGAAVAWSLADTKMRILCLEQGDWVKPTDYPSNGRDWEARLFADFAVNPNRRARITDPENDVGNRIIRHIPRQWTGRQVGQVLGRTTAQHAQQNE